MATLAALGFISASLLALSGRSLPIKVRPAAIAFAAGILLALAFGDLFPEGLALAGNGAIVAVVVVTAGVWVARPQGASELGQGGVNSSLLPKVGEPAPEFMTLYATGDNEVFRLSDLKGQPVWLNFWGSWCPPCRAEMPELQAAWEQLEPRGLVMIGASMKEDPKDSVAYAERVGATFPITVDPNYLTAVADPEALPELFETAATWQIRNFPTHVFIDRDGIVRAVVLNQMDTETAIAYGELILGTPPASPMAAAQRWPRPWRG